MFRTLAVFVTKHISPKGLYSTATPAKELPLLLKLSAEFEDVSRVLSVIENEELKNVKFEDWKERILLLKSYEFKDAECFKMISAYPPLLKLRFENMKTTVTSWIASDLGSKNFQYLLYHRPQMLDLEESDIRKRIPYLKYLYRSNISLVNLLVSCPNIMFEDWDTVVKKFNYLITEKGIERGELLKTKALSKSMDFLELRFLILEKCGIFKKPETLPHKKRKYNSTGHKNPSLTAIVDYNDKLFARQVAKISVEEYYVCSDLFQKEKYENDDDDDDGGEDD